MTSGRRLFPESWTANASQIATLRGTHRDDTLAAPGPWWIVSGLRGDDTLESTYSQTALLGGMGEDDLSTRLTFPAADSPEALADLLAIQAGGAGDDTLSATLEGATDAGDVVADLRLFGDGGDDVITVDAEVLAYYLAEVHLDTLVHGGAGHDTIRVSVVSGGVPGDEMLVNQIYGGPGDDDITALADGSFSGDGGTAINRIDGGAGHDRIDATAVVESNGPRLAWNDLEGGPGDDLLIAHTLTDSNTDSPVGRNTLAGGPGDDALVATHETDGENYVTTLENRLDGGTHDDSLKGDILALAESESYGLNMFEGGGGDDHLEAEVLARALYVMRATNELHGADGHDTLMAFAEASSLCSSHPGDAYAHNLLDGGPGNDVLSGEIGAGGPGHSTLLGGDGDDQLAVVGGVDNVLDGGAGRDRLVSGEGSDEMTGGSEADAYVFLPNSGLDIIPDFQQGLDVMDVSEYGFGDFGELAIEADGPDAVVRFAPDDAVTVVGMAGHLAAEDFLIG